MIPKKVGKVKAGLQVPRPDGALWRKLQDAAVDGKDVSDRIKAFGADISDTSELRINKEEERLNTQLATEVVKAWNAVLGNCEANREATGDQGTAGLHKSDGSQESD